MPSSLLFRYARQLEKKGLLKLVYVMMQEECVSTAAVAFNPAYMFMPNVQVHHREPAGVRRRLAWDAA
jgi:hypothetical protein